MLSTSLSQQLFSSGMFKSQHAMFQTGSTCPQRAVPHIGWFIDIGIVFPQVAGDYWRVVPQIDERCLWVICENYLRDV